MNSVPFPTNSSRVRSRDSISFYEGLFFASLLLFVVVACAWPVLAWRIHHFSVYIPDADHTFLLRERTGIVYLKPWFGKLYVSLPWLWFATLGLTVLTGFLTGKRPGGSK
jgi:hypothetical protein